MSQWVTLILTELLGTALQIMLGNGIVANSVLKGTKGNNPDWLAINLGWGVGATVAATFVLAFPGGAGYFNPAIAIAKAISNFDQKFVHGIGLTSIRFGILLFFGIILLELVGAMLGQIIIDLVYYKHIQTTLLGKDDFATANVLSIHATNPTTKTMSLNFGMEFLATMILVGSIMTISKYGLLPPLIRPLMVGIIVLAIKLSLRGTTGCAINPVRDLGPRIIHTLLPINHKGTSEWSYSWLPIVAPMIAGIIIGGVFLVV